MHTKNKYSLLLYICYHIIYCRISNFVTVGNGNFYQFLGISKIFIEYTHISKYETKIIIIIYVILRYNIIEYGCCLFFFVSIAINLMLRKQEKRRQISVAAIESRQYSCMHPFFIWSLHFLFVQKNNYQFN